MNTQPTLHEMQAALVRLCSQSELDEYARSGEGNEVENKILNSVDLPRLDVYSSGTYSKRLYFSRNIFRLTSQGMGLKAWRQIVSGYWKTQKTNAAKPVTALSALPEYIREKSEPENGVWAEVADYELTLDVVTDLQDEFVVNGRGIPKELAKSKARPVINPTARVKAYHYSVPTILKQVEARRKPSLDRLDSAIYLVLYLDPSTKLPRVQQVGRVAANAINLALNNPTRFCELFNIVREQLQDKPSHIVEHSLRTLLEQLRTAGLITAVLPGELRRF